MVNETLVYRHLASDARKIRELTDWTFSLVDGIRDMLLEMGHEEDKPINEKLMDAENHYIRAIKAMAEIRNELNARAPR